jgi:hypothetical protein
MLAPAKPALNFSRGYALPTIAHSFLVTHPPQREVQKALRKVVYVKYQIKDQDWYDKAFEYIRQYY